MRIVPDDVTHPAVLELLDQHLSEMRATSPACSVHALEADKLRAPDVSVWTAWEDDALLGIGALKEIDAGHGEVKSMRTAPAARGRGVAAALLATVLAEARNRGYLRVSLETGSQEFFDPAVRLYRRHGFVDCEPFEGYGPDPNSRFLTLELA